MSKVGTALRTYDVIVIGSGMGALAFASVVAQVARKQVLVLERHFKPGGFTQTFSRQGFTWDVGLHYVGEMGEGSFFRQIFDFITGSRVRWRKMPPRFDRFVYPDLTVEMPDDPRAFQQDLIRHFPDEADAIRQYFREVRAVARWYQREMAVASLRSPLAALLRGLNRTVRGRALQTTKAYLDARFRDPRLKGILASQWANYGLPPSQSAFAMHALIVQHYLAGGYYPEGGAGTIAEAVVPIVREAGGEVRVNCEVTEILVKDGAACGVRALCRRGASATEIEFHAPAVVSGAGAYATLVRLLPDAPLGEETRAALDRVAFSGFGVVSLYLGLRESPAAFGFRGENHWLFEGYDHDALFERRNELSQGRAVMAYLSFPSLKDPGVAKPVAEVIAPVGYELFEPWRSRPWRRRGDDYEALKRTISEALLGLVERHYPGFRQLVVYQELSTPLTVQHFTGAPRGAVYGLPATPERFHRGWLGPRTPVRNLLLTGADTASPGITGAMMGGVMTASYFLGSWGFPRIMAAVTAHARRTQSEQR